MKIVLTVLITFLIFSGTPAAIAQPAVEVYAKGENTYFKFTDDPYDSSKRYVVIQLSPAGNKPNVVSEIPPATIVVVCEWKTPDDIGISLSNYQIRASLTETGKIRLDGPGYTLSTTSDHSYLVLLDNKPQVLCCGPDCTKRLRTFFKLSMSK